MKRPLAQKAGLSFRGGGVRGLVSRDMLRRKLLKYTGGHCAEALAESDGLPRPYKRVLMVLFPGKGSVYVQEGSVCIFQS